jgi:magnesium transporter
MLNQLLRESGDFVTRETELYVRDSYDHAMRIIDLSEALREIASDLMNTYLSAVSNRMNEIMKVLTIIATIFIPLSFVAGLYGMNFDRSVSPWNMPELGWRFGYPFALGVMAAVAVAFLVYFRRKGWLR